MCSYVLTQDQLAHTKFRWAVWTNRPSARSPRSRASANARKHDSQDICFVPDGDYVGFMERYTGKYYPDGDFLDVNGNVVGRHHGAVRYTCGQRKGVGRGVGRTGLRLRQGYGEEHRHRRPRERAGSRRR